MRCSALGQKRQVGSCPGCQPKIQPSVGVGAEAIMVSSTLRMATTAGHTSSIMQWAPSHALILSLLPWSACYMMMAGIWSRRSRNGLGGETLQAAAP